MLVEAVVVTLAVVAYRESNKRKPAVLTPERKALYESALNTLKDPEKLRALADIFEKNGFTVEPELLRKRAALRSLPKETKDARREAFKKALRSSNVEAIEAMALAFEQSTAYGAADVLRKYARGLRILDPIEIEKIAADYDKQKHTESATILRQRAQELRDAKAKEEAQESEDESPRAATIPAPAPHVNGAAHVVEE